MTKVFTWVVTGLFLSFGYLGNVIAAPDVALGQNMSTAHSILVTYKDRSIGRKSVISAGHRYRSRGAYTTTAWGRRMAEEISGKYQVSLVSQWPISELGVYCVVYRVPDTTTVEAVLALLRRDPLIEAVQPMNEFHTLAQTYNDPYYRLQNNIQLMQVGAAHKYATGENIRVVIIDTGIDQSHPDLAGQIVSKKRYRSSESDPRSADAHGTAVAGVIGAIADNRKGIVGIAPKAKLFAFKACMPATKHSLEAVCNSLSLATALNSAIRMYPDIINMSLGGPPDMLLRRLINVALDRGIIVVAAAAAQGQGFPASMKGVFAVSNDADIISNDMDWVVAPGQDVLTTIPGDTYEYISGSSISAATVSGLIALMLQLDPGLSHEEIALLLKNSTREEAGRSVLTLNACTLLAGLSSELIASDTRPVTCGKVN